jgi:copper chaperone CopZ
MYFCVINPKRDVIMKKLLILPLFILAACGQAGSEKVAEANTTYEMKIEGMTCASGCKKLIEKKMALHNGVIDFKIDFESAMATVVFDDRLTDTTALRMGVSEINNGAYSASGQPDSYRKM